MKKLLTIGLALVLAVVMVIGAAMPVSASALSNLCDQLTPPITGTSFNYTRNYTISAPSYLSATLGGDSWLNGVYDGWCGDTSRTIANGATWTAYCSYSSLPAGLVAYQDQLPKVNWILNQTWAAPYTASDIQVAIWALLSHNGVLANVPTNALNDVGFEELGRVAAIITAANAYPAFEPGAGGKLVIVLKLVLATVQKQTVLITYPIPPEENFQGCTPGFWKGNADNWNHSAWIGYEPWGPTGNYDFNTVFGIPEQELNANGKNLYTNPTLREALDANGSGINLLARSAVAALLNASNPDINYALDTATIFHAVQHAVGGTAGPLGNLTIGQLGSLLDGYNNAGCSIDQHWMADGG